MTNKNLKSAFEFFEKRQYDKAKDIFLENNFSYEAGMCFLLLRDLIMARRCFEIKQDYCPASFFGIQVINIIEDKPLKKLGYFQVRSFLELFLNLLITNSNLDYAQKIIDKYDYFTRFNLEVPKFLARVLYATGYTKVVHNFAQYAKEICKFDAEIYHIDASLYIDEKNYDSARENIKECLSFAAEYYPILKLKELVDEKSA